MVILVNVDGTQFPMDTTLDQRVGMLLLDAQNSHPIAQKSGYEVRAAAGMAIPDGERFLHAGGGNKEYGSATHGETLAVERLFEEAGRLAGDSPSADMLLFVKGPADGVDLPTDDMFRRYADYAETSFHL